MKGHNEGIQITEMSLIMTNVGLCRRVAHELLRKTCMRLLGFKGEFVISEGQRHCSGIMSPFAAS